MNRIAPAHFTQCLPVYKSEAFRVSNGANLGDAVSFADEMVLDDIYRVTKHPQLQMLQFEQSATPPFSISAKSDVGVPGAPLHVDCCVTFMSGQGVTCEAIILVETDGHGDVAEVYLLPLANFTPKGDYALVGISRNDALQKYAQVACMSFARGTRIATANGMQKPIEQLQVGDMILTRDHGPQPLRWIGQNIVRAAGEFAPVVITAGAMNNAADLVVSPEHRLFIYQRRDHIGAGRAELLVKARHLVNGTTVKRREGGHVEYFQMLFDTHQIVYAEGIAAESMLLDPRTSAALPADLEMTLGRLPGHDRSQSEALEVNETLLNRPDLAEILKKSSGG